MAVTPNAHLFAETKSGGTVELNADPATCYGFVPGQVVHFTKSLRNGKVALIRGSADGLLWFAVFPTVDHALTAQALKAPVDSASCRAREEFIRQFGWMVDEKTNPFV